MNDRERKDRAYIACKKLIAAVLLTSGSDSTDEELNEWAHWMLSDLANDANKALNDLYAR